MTMKGFIYAIISALFFGCAGLFVKNGYSDNFSPVDLLMLQYIIASFILLFLCLVKYRDKLLLSKGMLVKLFIQGAIGNTLMTVCFYKSFQYLDMAVATMLLFTYPAIVSIASFFIFKVKISKVKLMSILGTFIGCILVLNIFFSNIRVNYTGVIYAILAALFYSFMNIYAEGIVSDIPGLVITFYTTIFSLLVLFIFNFGFIDKLQHLPISSIENAAILAFFCEIIPLTLLYEAIKRIGSVTTSIISSLELPASAIVAFLFLDEKLTFIQVVGIVIVIFCVIKLKNEPQANVE
jgi:drug/metabolite transporter (DMT)-like permease